MPLKSKMPSTRLPRSFPPVVSTSGATVAASAIEIIETRRKSRSVENTAPAAPPPTIKDVARRNERRSMRVLLRCSGFRPERSDEIASGLNVDHILVGIRPVDGRTGGLANPHEVQRCTWHGATRRYPDAVAELNRNAVIIARPLERRCRGGTWRHRCWCGSRRRPWPWSWRQGAPVRLVDDRTHGAVIWRRQGSRRKGWDERADCRAEPEPVGAPQRHAATELADERGMTRRVRIEGGEHRQRRHASQNGAVVTEPGCVARLVRVETIETIGPRSRLRRCRHCKHDAHNRPSAHLTPLE